LILSFGFTERLLRVDLTHAKISVETPDDAFYRRYCGGRGLISYLLLRELEQGSDALSAENKLIFACGPVTGAPVSGAGRHSVGAKSPLTGGYGEAEAGGFWGAELKSAGYDAIIFEGKSKDPVYLWINNDAVEIRSATHLWGKQTLQANESIKNEVDSASVRIAAIGPGGENLVRYASIIHDLKHVAGRCGLGAVMGSKNLKAVAVKGTNPLKVAKPKKLGRLSSYMGREVDKLAHNYHNYGTGAAMDVFEETGNLPVRNFKEGLFPKVDQISAQAVKKTVSVGMGTCFACVVRCKKIVQVKDSNFTVDPAYGGPEYETLAAFGSNCGVEDLKVICKANELCQGYSLDTISTGVTISFAMECYEKGFLTNAQTDGVDLNFGNSQAMLTMIERIGQREGFGNILAEGTKRMAEKLGNNTEVFAVQVKGQEVPMHDPRPRRGQGLGYAVSPTGADHMHNIYDNLYIKKIPREARGLGVTEPVSALDMGPKKARQFYYISTWNSLDNVLCMCMFVPWTVNQKTNIVRHVTGWDTNAFELLKISERAINLARVFNIREGFGVDEDSLPPRLMEPKANGVLSQVSINPKEFEEMKRSYYKIAGWDSRGIPTPEKLYELDIGWAISHLPQ
jgi:aldehyde:ferredoxin oxidoreductase